MTAALPEVSGFADLLVARAALRLSNVGWLHLEAPLAIVALDFPAGAQVSELALGNVELGFTQHFQLGDQARFELLASLLAPTAEHGPERSLLKLRALALAAALSGGKRSASLTSGAIGTRWEATVSHEEGPLELRGTLEAALLARLSNAGLPDDAAVHDVGVLPVLEARATYQLTSWLGASLGTSLVTEPWRLVDPSRDHERRSRLQLVVEPALSAACGRHFDLGLDGSIPVGGNLGGNAFAAGLRARVSY